MIDLVLSDMIIQMRLILTAYSALEGESINSNLDM